MASMTTDLLSTAAAASRICEISRTLWRFRVAITSSASIARLLISCGAGRGAHPEAHLRRPDPDEMSRLLDRAGDGMKMVTLAPEMEGAAGLIRLLKLRARCVQG